MVMLSNQTERGEMIAWTNGAMEQLAERMDQQRLHKVMTGCACRYPKESLTPVREKYLRTGDVDIALGMLQNQFENFLRESLALSQGQIDTVVGRGWGLAGIRRGNVVGATKIPKSGYLRAYLNETDPQQKRE